MMGTLKGKVSASRSGRNASILPSQVASDKEFSVFRSMFNVRVDAMNIVIACMERLLFGCDVFRGKVLHSRHLSTHQLDPLAFPALTTFHNLEGATEPKTARVCEVKSATKNPTPE
jgi:hypothetical protein